MTSRLGAVGPPAAMMFLTFLLGSFAAILLSVQPEWRSREDTARALVAICVFGAPLVGLTVAVLTRVPWRRWVRAASLAAYATIVACYSLIYVVLAMPDWFTSTDRDGVRQLTDIASVLLIWAILTVLGSALGLAMLLLTAAVTSRPAGKRASAESAIRSAPL